MVICQLNDLHGRLYINSIVKSSVVYRGICTRCLYCQHNILQVLDHDTNVDKVLIKFTNVFHFLKPKKNKKYKAQAQAQACNILQNPVANFLLPRANNMSPYLVKKRKEM